MQIKCPQVFGCYEIHQLIDFLDLMGSGMSRSTLGNIEAGIRNIKASDLKAIKMALEAEYEEFFGERNCEKQTGRNICR